jgi:hypothetical protein
VKETSVIASVQFGLGQSGAPGIGLTGACVVTSIDTVPFLIADAGTATGENKSFPSSFLYGLGTDVHVMVVKMVGWPKLASKHLFYRNQVSSCRVWCDRPAKDWCALKY